jgi:hypothetical protein
MYATLIYSAKIVGSLGVLLMLIAIVARLAGYYTLGGLASVTLLLAGIATVCVGCFLLLWALTGRSDAT